VKAQKSERGGRGREKEGDSTQEGRWGWGKGQISKPPKQ